MIQVIKAPETFGSQFGKALGGGFSKGIETQLQQKLELAKADREAKEFSKLFTRPKQAQQDSTEQQLKGENPQQVDVNALKGETEGAQQQGLAKWSELAPEMQAYALKKYPQQARILAEQENAQKKQELGERKFEFEKEKYGSEESKKYREKLREVAEGIPERRISIDTAKAATQTGAMTPFGGDFWADVLHVPGLRSESGALLNTSAKNHLVASLNRIPGARPNQFIEKQIADSFARTGQTKEANMAQLLFAETLLDMDENKISTADRIMESYEAQGKSPPSYLDREVRVSQKDFNQQRMDKLAYDLQENRESIQSPQEMHKLKKVPNGTPLTYEMKEVLMEEVNQDPKKAEKLAKALGYEIPDVSFYQRGE